MLHMHIPIMIIAPVVLAMFFFMRGSPFLDNWYYVAILAWRLDVVNMVFSIFLWAGHKITVFGRPA